MRLDDSVLCEIFRLRKAEKKSYAAIARATAAMPANEKRSHLSNHAASFAIAASSVSRVHDPPVSALNAAMHVPHQHPIHPSFALPHGEPGECPAMRRASSIHTLPGLNAA